MCVLGKSRCIFVYKLGDLPFKIVITYVVFGAFIFCVLLLQLLTSISLVSSILEH